MLLPNNQNNENRNKGKIEVILKKIKIFGKKFGYGTTTVFGRIVRAIRSTILIFVGLGILSVLQEHGSFVEYPAIHDIVGAVLGASNWISAIIMDLINWIIALV